jgi:uncharacterized protein (DUF2336 family)
MLDVLKHLLGTLHPSRGTAESTGEPVTPTGSTSLSVAEEMRLHSRLSAVDHEIKIDLARKIARLMPGLGSVEAQAVGALALSTLEALADDQMPRVRAVLAEELKSSPYVPKSVVDKLARDAETLVSIPILQYSPLLNDADLCEIIATGVTSQALSAIARRATVSAPVSDAIVSTLDIPAVAALLANPRAEIREKTLDRIIAAAKNVVEWHEGLVFRPDLSIRAARRISGFVASALVEKLAERNDLGEDVATRLAQNLRHRITQRPVEVELSTAQEEVEALASTGKLDEAAVAQAIAAGKREFVHHALARLSGLSVAAVTRLFASRSGNAVVALAWRAKLSTGMAMKLQTQFARLPAEKLAYPQGGMYPQDNGLMEALLNIFAQDDGSQ